MTLESGVPVDAWLRTVVPSDDVGVSLSQTAVVVLAGLAIARVRDWRFAADGMFDGGILLLYT